MSGFQNLIRGCKLFRSKALVEGRGDRKRSGIRMIVGRNASPRGSSDRLDRFWSESPQGFPFPIEPPSLCFISI
jgi:hypothetical protein